MTDHFKQNSSDTQPEPRTMPTAPVAKDSGLAATESLAPQNPGTVNPSDPGDPGDLWPEAADARCSESAALFSGTQPAPLSVV